MGTRQVYDAFQEKRGNAILTQGKEGREKEKSTGKESEGGFSPAKKGKKKKKQLAVIDFETDPFERGQKVAPFAWGFYDGSIYVDYWGDDAAEKLALFLTEYEEPLLIYAHNGGKFDYLFMLPYMLDQQPMVINGRIVQWFYENHELRDSYSILPVPLKQSGEKKEMDYSKMKRGVRWRHKREILDYLKADCLALYQMVTQFKKNLGQGLTMAGIATRLLKAETPCLLEKLNVEQDAAIRNFFFGGRVECFTKGIIRENLLLMDVRSMYPAVMKDFLHPVGNTWVETRDIYDADFLEIDATSLGSFPLRTRDGLSFPHGRAIYRITGHEFRAAKECDRVVVHRVIRAIRFIKRTNFTSFISKFSELRKACAEEGDEVGKLHYKLVQNSSYGRFALNPERLFSWYITGPGQPKPGDDYEPAYAGDHAIFWRKPATLEEKAKAISNVATGASITGAARARLLLAIASSERPVYCDTDSIIAKSLNVPPDNGDIGQWQLEANANKMALAGKKLYALFGEPANDERERKKRLKEFGHPLCIKLASKGVRLTAQEIERVCMGETVTWQSESPTFNLSGKQEFMIRQVRMTA